MVRTSHRSIQIELCDSEGNVLTGRTVISSVDVDADTRGLRLFASDNSGTVKIDGAAVVARYYAGRSRTPFITVPLDYPIFLKRGTRWHIESTEAKPFMCVPYSIMAEGECWDGD